MHYIQGTDRTQAVIFQDCLDNAIDPDNEVRLIDLFVQGLDLRQHRFDPRLNPEGRPAYDPKDLLRLFIYGYLNGIRSSRALERECQRNIEVMWLMRKLAPDHNTIANFRRDNHRAIQRVFRSTVRMARDFDLIGGRLLAGDSTKLRAQNSKKNNFNQKKIDRHLEYIDTRLGEYSAAMATADGDDRTALQAQVDRHSARRGFYEGVAQQLDETGEVQVSTSDPDSRQLITRNSITEVAYNLQTTVDAKNSLIVDSLVTNTNDSKAMGPMLRRASAILGNSGFTALYDKGYHTGSELRTASELGVEVMVAVPDISSASMAPDPAYNVSGFVYHECTHTYTCPQGHALTTNGRWYAKDRNAPGRTKNPPIMVQHFKTPQCKSCPVLHLCTKNTRGRGRVIERSEFQPYVDANRRNLEARPDLYKRRQAIVEHPFGILKRQWGFYYIMTKRGIQRASADTGLMVTAFNLRRIMNIIPKNDLKKYLMARVPSKCITSGLSEGIFSLFEGLLPGAQLSVGQLFLRTFAPTAHRIAFISYF